MLSVKYALVCLCLLPGVLSTEEQEPKAKAKPSQAEVWGYGILFVTIISLASVVGVAVFPVMSKSFYPRLMTALIGLAVGSLASSSVFHLIPEAFRHLLLTAPSNWTEPVSVLVMLPRTAEKEMVVWEKLEEKMARSCSLTTTISISPSQSWEGYISSSWWRDSSRL